MEEKSHVPPARIVSHVAPATVSTVSAVPGAPSQLHVGDVTATSVLLEWTSPSDTGKQDKYMYSQYAV